MGEPERSMEKAPTSEYELGQSAVRALVLYSLAEFQWGHCTSIRVEAEARRFVVEDNGRGHSPEKKVGHVPYVQLVYLHLAFPFEQDGLPPVQLQGIGMSLINVLCSELHVAARRETKTLCLSYSNGFLSKHELLDVPSSTTGNTISGTLSPVYVPCIPKWSALGQWLRGLAKAAPSLQLSFNGEKLSAV